MNLQRSDMNLQQLSPDSKDLLEIIERFHPLSVSITKERMSVSSTETIMSRMKEVEFVVNYLLCQGILSRVVTRINFHEEREWRLFYYE